MQRSSVEAIRTFLDADILVSITKYAELAGHRYNFLVQERASRSLLRISSIAQLLQNKPLALKDIEKSFDYFFNLDRSNYNAVHALSSILKGSLPNNKILSLIDMDSLSLFENGLIVQADTRKILSLTSGPINFENIDASGSTETSLNSESSAISSRGTK